METFSWVPLVDAEGETKFGQLKAQFGDGYAARVGDGLNVISDSWPLTFCGESAEIYPIRDFLERYASGRGFLWQAPGRSSAGIYCVAGYKLKPHGGDMYTLTVTFDQTFQP